MKSISAVRDHNETGDEVQNQFILILMFRLSSSRLLRLGPDGLNWSLEYLRSFFWSLNIGLSVPVILPPRVKLAADIWRKSVLYFFIRFADRYPPGYSKCASGLLGR